MQFLTLSMMVVVLSISYFTGKTHLLPKEAAFLPEVISGLVLIYVVIAGARTRFRNVRAQYWIVFGILLVVMVCGVLANAEPPGPIFAGLRYYLRAIPFFLLPAVYEFTPKQIRQQLWLLLVFAFVQLPLALRQRMIVMDAGRWSGDSVKGSLEDSSLLSLFLILVACVLTAMWMRGRLSLTRFVPLFFLVLIPTTINETKATLILLPIGLVVAMLVASPPGKRLQVGMLAAGLLVAFMAIFAPIYDYLERNNPYRTSISDFFTNGSTLNKYVDQNADSGSVHVGRVDAIVVPLRHLTKEPSQFVFGVGIGNASHSSLGEKFTGDYFPLFQLFLLSSLTSFLLEIGVLGTLLVFWLYWLIWCDSLAVARSDNGLDGTIAAAWAGVTAIVAVAMPYKTTYVFASLSYLFWYYSGVVAARRMILVNAAAAAAPGPVSPWPVLEPSVAPARRPALARAGSSPPVKARVPVATRAPKTSRRAPTLGDSTPH